MNIKCSKCNLIRYSKSFSNNSTICNNCQLHDSKPVFWRNLIDKDKLLALKDYNNGSSIKDIARKFNIHYFSLYRNIKEYSKTQSLKDNPATIESILYRKITSFCSGSKRFSVKEFLDNNPPKCYITNVPIDLLDSSTYSLNHIVPKSKGGKSSLDNCGLCLREVAICKHNLTKDEFIALCLRVTENN
jgi:5-methylcytosine-specific restriction endonuclease McrA